MTNKPFPASATDEQSVVSAALALPTDGRFSDQWHLRNTIPGRLDLNVTEVWDGPGVTYTGDGVMVAVMDDGLQRTHHDLDANYSYARDWDFRDDDTNPSPGVGDSHGTAVAGIIGANRDGNGTVGIAYDATLFGYRVGEFIDDALIRTMTGAANYASGIGGGGRFQADVMNMSYGTMYAGNWFDDALTGSLMDTLNRAFDDGAARGRDGLGTIYVKSGGNSRDIDHDANASSWNANRHTISVAAVDQDGGVSSYSTHGSNLLVSAFGTPGQVVTTDRTGSAGYSSGDYTSGFNGTSAAAPMVSGVVALMLEANPTLGWRDVQSILAMSARHVGSDVGSAPTGDEEYRWQFNNADTWNGGGMHFSRDYGFGLVDAHAAVRLAETWGTDSATSANDRVASHDLFAWNAAETIDGVSNGGDTSATRGTESYRWTETQNVLIEQVTVELDFETTYLDDFEMVLTSPDGTRHQIINDIGGGRAFGVGGGDRWTFTTNAFWGEESAGRWTLTLTDDAGGDETIVYDVDVRAYGAAVTADDVFVFTNEYSDYVRRFGHSPTITGGDGVDTLNAAAVTADTDLDLTVGGGVIDGVLMKARGIERVITGGGDDTIVGNGETIYLAGGRGADTITGGSRVETIDGGAGHDTLRGVGADTVYGGQGSDVLYSSGRGFYDAGIGNDTVHAGLGTQETLNGGSGIDWLHTTTFDGDYEVNLATGRTNYGGERFTGFERLITGDGDDRLTGSAVANHLIAGRGDDVLEGAGGADTLRGGAGSDRFVFKSVAHSTAGDADTIRDFDGAGVRIYRTGTTPPDEDVIDLSAIDADVTVGGNQAFTFHGVKSAADALALDAGALWVSRSGADTLVQAKVDDDAAVDLMIRLTDGSVSARDYVASDFIV